MQICAFGHFTPSHGSLPHEPVAGSQYAPFEQGRPASVTHLSGPQVEPESPKVAQTWPLVQAGSQLATRSPSTHFSVLLQVTSAQLATQRGSVKVEFGLHTSPGLHGFGSQ